MEEDDILTMQIDGALINRLDNEVDWPEWLKTNRARIHFLIDDWLRIHKKFVKKE